MPAEPINAHSVSERADDPHVALTVIPFANCQSKQGIDLSCSLISPDTNGIEVEISKQNDADHPAEAVVQAQESQPASKPRTTSTRTPRRRAKRAPAQTFAHNLEVGNDGRKPQTGTVDNPISQDELAALHADNKRLMRLLAERLRSQNLWLKKR